VVNANAQTALTPVKSLSTNSTGSWAGHRAALDGHEVGKIACHYKDSNTNCSACSKSLSQLLCPGSIDNCSL